MRWGRARCYEGRVARTAYELNPQYRTLLVEIDLPNADGHLRPGQHGRAEIELETRENVITIPSSAMVQRNDDGSAACFRVTDGRAVRTRIEVGLSARGLFEVLEGLKEGDLVITKPDSRTADGKPVAGRLEGKDPARSAQGSALIGPARGVERARRRGERRAPSRALPPLDAPPLNSGTTTRSGTRPCRSGRRPSPCRRRGRRRRSPTRAPSAR